MNNDLKENSKVTGHEKQHVKGRTEWLRRQKWPQQRKASKKKKKRISSSQLRKVKALKVKVADSYETYK